jgi:hypothetical protein
VSSVLRIINDIQDAFTKEADKVAKGNSGIPATGNGQPNGKPPVPNNQQGQKGTEPNQGPQPKAQPAATVPPPTTVPVTAKPANEPAVDQGGNQLSALLKEKYGIDLSDDEIMNRLKPNDGPNQPNSTPQAVSVPVPVAPRIEDVTDDDIGVLLEANGRSRDLLKRAADISKVDDISLVRQSYIDYLKEHHKRSDEDAEALFAERFYIPPEGKEDSYTAEEIAIGKALLKQEADRIRGQVTNVINGARQLVHTNRMAEYDKKTHDSQVDAFIGGVNRKLVIPIGKSGAKDLGDYSFDINDTIVKEIAETMKSPERLIKKFKKADKDELDFQKFFDFLVHYEIRDNLVKSIASHYHSLGTDEIEATLHNLPDLNNTGQSHNKTKKTASELKKEAEDYNKEQIRKNLSRQHT